MDIVGFSVHHRLVVLLFVSILLAVGVFQARQLPVDAVPDITPNQVLVITRAPGFAPLDVERLVSTPMEAVMSGLPQLKRLRSISKYGLSIVYVTFHDGYPLQLAREQVFRRIGDARERLPKTIPPTEMGPTTTGLGEIYQFQLKGPSRSLMELRTILEWEIAPKIRMVPGVIEFNINGGHLKTYEIRVRANELIRYGVTMDQLIAAVENNNGARGGSAIESDGGQRLIRGEALIEGTSDIENIVLAASPDGTPIFVRNVAEVVTTPRFRIGAVTRDGGGEVVIGTVMMLIGENPGRVIEGVKAAIDDIKVSLTPGVVIDPFYDRTDLVNATISTVTLNLAEGASLVVVVLLLMLGNLRGGLIVASVIPLSMVAALCGMYYAGLTGNLMSLGAIDFGLLVDGAVVIVEHVMARRARPAGAADGHGIEGVAMAAREVTRPVFFGVTIITLVYMPVLALEGVEGRMFRPMALTVIFALIASLVLAVTLMPALSTFAFHKEIARKDPFVVAWMRKVYRPALLWTMGHPLTVVTIAVCVFSISVLAASRMGAEFIPRLDEGSMTITSYRVQGSSLADSVRSTTLIEKTLLSFPEVTTTVTVIGSAEIPVDPMGIEESDTFVKLRPRKEWVTADSRDALAEKFDAALKEQVPGNRFSYSQPIEMRMQDLLVGIKSDLGILLFGDDLATLKRVAEEIYRVVDRIQGSEDARIEQVAGLPSVKIKVNREAIARHGMNASEVLELVDAMGGRAVGQVIEGQRRFGLQVRLHPDDRRSVAELKELRLRDPQGRLVPLGQVAEVTLDEGASQVTHERMQRRILIETNVRNRDIVSFVGEAQREIRRQIVLPPGYWLHWGGQFENLQQASARLSLVVPIALAMIFVLLFTALGSASLALLVFVNVPIAASGGVLSLYLTGQPFSISAAIGFIALFGVAVLNGLVLVTSIEHRRSITPDLWTAIREGAGERMRPVMITALVAGLGFMPMALSQGSGAEVQRPLATVVIGGLVTSTLLTLLLLPAVYRWFLKLGDTQAAKARAAAAAAAPQPAE